MFRAVLILIAISIYTLILCTTAILISPFDRRGIGYEFLARSWVKLVLLTSCAKVSVSGLEYLGSHGPYIFMSNHSSHFDVPAIVVKIPFSLRFIAKKELLKVPVFGWAVYATGHIIIDRSNQEKAFKSIDLAAERVRKGTSVLVFAEGTRSPDGKLQPFKKGGFVLAIKSGVPVVPIGVTGSRDILPKGAWKVKTGGRIKVVIGKPIETKNYNLENKEGLMEQVRQTISNNMDMAKALYEAERDKD